ncbi:uncharacterized protein LOC127924866 [Oncorhynchus keta]|uniref:uncharacterized protein LOC127924866 n=1 Tax=Oncorhynchus keta TaxID=8018 RepID=UPI00227BA4FF|nr:uncharacterized protein LOC127924866 [Oncorhynchus keta]
MELGKEEWEHSLIYKDHLVCCRVFMLPPTGQEEWEHSLIYKDHLVCCRVFVLPPTGQEEWEHSLIYKDHLVCCRVFMLPPTGKEEWEHSLIYKDHLVCCRVFMLPPTGQEEWEHSLIYKDHLVCCRVFMLPPTGQEEWEHGLIYKDHLVCCRVFVLPPIGQEEWEHGLIYKDHLVLTSLLMANLISLLTDGLGTPTSSAGSSTCKRLQQHRRPEYLRTELHRLQSTLAREEGRTACLTNGASGCHGMNRQNGHGDVIKTSNTLRLHVPPAGSCVSVSQQLSHLETSSSEAYKPSLSYQNNHFISSSPTPPQSDFRLTPGSIPLQPCLLSPNPWCSSAASATQFCPPISRTCPSGSTGSRSPQSPRPTCHSRPPPSGDTPFSSSFSFIQQSLSLDSLSSNHRTETDTAAGERPPGLNPNPQPLNRRPDLNPNPQPLNRTPGLNPDPQPLNSPPGLNPDPQPLNSSPGLNPDPQPLNSSPGLNPDPQPLNSSPGLNPDPQPLNRPPGLNPDPQPLNRPLA